MHKRGFSPKNRGVFWEVQRKEPPADKQVEESKENKTKFPDDLDLLCDLKKLNEHQIKANRLVPEIKSLQQEYYFLWYKQASKVVKAYEVADFDFESARKKIHDPLAPEKGQLGQLFKELNTLKAAIKTAKSKVSNHAALAKADSEFELIEKLEDRFWEPNEPVLLLCGTGIGNIDKPNFQTGRKSINCRSLDQVYTSLELRVPKGSDTPVAIDLSVDLFSIANLDQLSSESLPAKEIKALAYESLLLDQGLAPDIALLAYQEAEIGEGKTKDNSPAIKNFAESTVIPKQKSLPSPEAFFIQKWQQA